MTDANEFKLSLYEDELYGAEGMPEPMRQLVIFSLSSEWYGVDVAHVSEVLSPPPSITFLPNVPDHIIGIINLRGNILSVTNLKTIFGLSDQQIQEKHRIVVIDEEGTKTGLIVDGSEEVVDIPSSKIEAAVVSREGVPEDMLEGQVLFDEKLIAVLRVPQVIERTRS